MDEYSTSSEDDEPPRFGLGVSTSQKRERAPPAQLYTDSEPSASSEDDIPDTTDLPASFGGAKARVRKRRRTSSRHVSSTLEGAENEGRSGEWERHTRGIGSKILAKHGFTGRLGKREDGISAPIEALVRPGKLGLGAGAFAEKGEDQVIRETAHRHDRETATSMTHRKGMSEALLEESRFGNIAEKGKTVLDMRGSAPVEVESVAEALTRAEGSQAPTTEERDQDLFAAPEVLYSLRMLTDNAHLKIADSKRRRDTEKLILNTTDHETRKAKEETEGAQRGLKFVVRMESSLKGLVEALDKDDGRVFEDALTTLVASLPRRSEEVFIPTPILTSAFIHVVTKRVNSAMKTCLLATTLNSKAEQKLARHLHVVLSLAREVLSADDYVRVCARTVLTPVRTHMSHPDWDVVKGACVADALSIIRPVLPDTMVHILAEDVLVSKLVAQLKAQNQLQKETRVEKDAGTGGLNGKVPSHVWIHPWLPITGRRPLVEVFHYVRMGLTEALRQWEVSDSLSKRDSLIAEVKIWSSVLSRKRMQLALARYVTPKLIYGLAVFDADLAFENETPAIFDAIRAWAEVCSARLLSSELSVPFVDGPGSRLREEAFRDGGWDKARGMYVSWSKLFPDRLRDYMKPAFAVLLFVLHAGQVVTDVATRKKLLKANMAPLLKNRFARSTRSDMGAKDRRRQTVRVRPESQKARLGDVVMMVARREGLACVGLGDEKGVPVFRVGNVRVVADVGRAVLTVGGKVVDVEEMVHLAKAR